MRISTILCLGVLFFVFERQSAIAQCGQTTHQPAVSATLPTVKLIRETARRKSTDGVVVLQLELTKIGLARSVEVLGEPGKLRTAAIFAAPRFTKEERFVRYSPTIITVTFPLKRYGAPKVEQVFLSGVPGCVVGGWASVMYKPAAPSSPPSWLFNVRHVMPVLAVQRTQE